MFSLEIHLVEIISGCLVILCNARRNTLKYLEILRGYFLECFEDPKTTCCQTALAASTEF